MLKLEKKTNTNSISSHKLNIKHETQNTNINYM